MCSNCDYDYDAERDCEQPYIPWCGRCQGWHFGVCLQPQRVLYRRRRRDRHPVMFAGLVFVLALVGALLVMVGLVTWLGG